MTAEIDAHWTLLNDLARQGGPLSTQGLTATTRWGDAYINGAPSARRRAMHSEVLSSVNLPSSVDDPPILMTAGPPGAGKSRVVHDEILRSDIPFEEWLVIDPDRFKDMLLERLVADGSYRARLLPKEVLAATDHIFFPREMASLVHEESSQLAKDMLRAGLEQGCPIVIDGLMASLPSAEATVSRIESARPNFSITVVCVEVDARSSETRARTRWEKRYQDALAEVSRDNTDPDRVLGGRFVPPEIHAAVFPDGRDSPSRSLSVALDIASSTHHVTGFRLYRSQVDEGPVLVHSADRQSSKWEQLRDAVRRT